jgi:hypothetical protein
LHAPDALRQGWEEEVGQEVVQLPKSSATYNGKPISPNCTLVDMVWVNPDFEHEELDFPTEEGNTLIGGALASRALWNKENIMLEMPTLASQPSYPSSSPPDNDDDDDDDDNSANGNDNAGGPGSNP